MQRASREYLNRHLKARLKHISGGFTWFFPIRDSIFHRHINRVSNNAIFGKKIRYMYGVILSVRHLITRSYMPKSKGSSFQEHTGVLYIITWVRFPKSNNIKAMKLHLCARRSSFCMRDAKLSFIYKTSFIKTFITKNNQYLQLNYSKTKRRYFLTCCTRTTSDPINRTIYSPPQ